MICHVLLGFPLPVKAAAFFMKRAVICLLSNVPLIAVSVTGVSRGLRRPRSVLGDAGGFSLLESACDALLSHTYVKSLAVMGYRWAQ